LSCWSIRKRREFRSKTCKKNSASPDARASAYRGFARRLCGNIFLACLKAYQRGALSSTISVAATANARRATVDFRQSKSIISHRGHGVRPLTAVLLKPGQMMTPDKGFLSRSHTPATIPNQPDALETGSKFSYEP
jgi:hypothetical protein